jgi:hypothetical protein
VGGENEDAAPGRRGAAQVLDPSTRTRESMTSVGRMK